MPSTITAIGESAFRKTAITELTFTNNIEFEQSALSNMPNLTSVNFASTQEKLSASLLYNCTSLTNISLPDSINCIERKAFNGTGLTTLDISNVRGVSGEAIYYLPEGCQIVANGPQSFWKDNVLYGDAGETILIVNNSVTNLVIDNSVKKIAEKAFYKSTSIQSVICGTGLEQIDTSAFCEASNLSSVVFTGNSLRTIGESAFHSSALKSVNLPEGLEVIKDSAFSGNTLLEEIYMPDTVTTLGKAAFRDCESMKTIRLSDNIETIHSSTFYGCDSLTYLKLPNNCTSVKFGGGSNDHFECKSLMMIEGPRSLVQNTNIKNHLSSYSTYLYKVYFYDEDEATCLKAFWCKSGADLSDVVEKPANLGQQFKKWKNRNNTLSTITNIVDNTTFVAEYVPGTVGSQYPKLKDKTEMKDVYVVTFYDEDEVTVLKKVLVKKNSNLSNLESVGELGLCDTKIKRLYLPNVKTIGSSAFDRNGTLEYLDLSSLEKATDFFSFQGISGIKVIYLNSDIQVMKEPSYANSEITPEAIKLTGDYSTVIENAIANWGTYNKAEDENGVKWYVRSGCEIPTTDYTYTDN